MKRLKLFFSMLALHVLLVAMGAMLLYSVTRVVFAFMDWLRCHYHLPPKWQAYVILAGLVAMGLSGVCIVVYGLYIYFRWLWRESGRVKEEC
jgi:hypothetical protein